MGALERRPYAHFYLIINVYRPIKKRKNRVVEPIRAPLFAQSLAVVGGSVSPNRPTVWSLGRFYKSCAGANSGVRDAFPAGAGERRHGQGGGRRDERVGVREAQRGQLLFVFGGVQRRRQRQVQRIRRDSLAAGRPPARRGNLPRVKGPLHRFDRFDH